MEGRPSRARQPSARAVAASESASITPRRTPAPSRSGSQRPARSNQSAPRHSRVTKSTPARRRDRRKTTSSPEKSLSPLLNQLPHSAQPPPSLSTEEEDLDIPRPSVESRRHSTDEGSDAETEVQEFDPSLVEFSLTCEIFLGKKFLWNETRNWRHWSLHDSTQSYLDQIKRQLKGRSGVEMLSFGPLATIHAGQGDKKALKLKRTIQDDLPEAPGGIHTIVQEYDRL